MPSSTPNDRWGQRPERSAENDGALTRIEERTARGVAGLIGNLRRRERLNGGATTGDGPGRASCELTPPSREWGGRREGAISENERITMWR